MHESVQAFLNPHPCKTSSYAYLPGVAVPFSSLRA
jgi:hypothetical protein